MKHEVVQHRHIPGQWHAEHIRQDGSIDVVIFTGPDAERRAREYADLMAPRRLSAQLDESLSYHRPDAEQLARIEKLRAAQKAYAAVLEELCPAGRPLSIAKTEFETHAMWAVKAIVIGAPKG